jgi:hypothetical protein
VHLEQSIRQHLVSYLAGDTPLEAFTAWLVRASWNVDQSGNRQAADLAYSIELALAEHAAGLLTEDELRNELFSLDVTTVSSTATP